MRILALLTCFAATAPATLHTLHVQERGDYAGGKQFGSAGVYERITAVGTNESGQTVAIEMIRPRDPALGTETLVVLSSGGDAELLPLLQKGWHLVRIGNTQSADAIRDLLVFLRYGGKPLLLSDSRRFVKRVVAHVPSGAPPTYREGVSTDAKDAQNRRIVDELHTSELSTLADRGR
jgi:hypothetical protein